MRRLEQRARPLEQPRRRPARRSRTRSRAAPTDAEQVLEVGRQVAPGRAGSGARSSAGSRRSRTSGSVLRAKLSSRSTVVRVSRRNVGSTCEGRPRAPRRARRAPRRWRRRPAIRPRRLCPSSPRSASNTRPVLRTRRRRATSCSASGRSSSAPAVEERRRVAERVVEVARRSCPSVAIPDSCSQSWKLRRVRSSKTLKISSSSTVSLDAARRGSEPPSGSVRRVAAAGRDLHVGLPQQALLAQDHAGVALDRGEAVVDLDLGDACGGRPEPSSLPLTLPTFTPAIRTSASSTSRAASGNAALKR